MRSGHAATWLVRVGRKATVAAHKRIVNGLRHAGNLLFPPACAFCGRDVRHDAQDRPLLCPSCIGRLRPLASPTCARCASPLPRFWALPDRCPRCRDRPYRFDRSLALGNYEAELRQAVLWMKRLSFEPLTHAMGLLLAEHVAQQWRDAELDVVVPVPMHWRRRFRRGTYTAAVLAGAVAQRLDLPPAINMLKCRRKSLKQGTLGPGERFRNMRGAFRFSSGYDITDKRVLLIDDIMTTGATANEAARILRQAGAEAVAVAVVARGIGGS